MALEELESTHTMDGYLKAYHRDNHRKNRLDGVWEHNDELHELGLVLVHDNNNRNRDHRMDLHDGTGMDVVVEVGVDGGAMVEV